MVKVLDKKAYNLIEALFKATQGELVQYLPETLASFYGEDRIVENKDFIMAIGDIPVGLVAHMDTVHRVPVKDLYYDREAGIMWSPQGLGADDRAGIFGIIELLQRGVRPTVILTTDEECGGIGAGSLIAKLPTPPCELNYLVELDRRGSRDCVFYECDNVEFEEYIELYDFTTNYGSFSDISIIAPTWGMAAVNLSIGYENEHSLQETLNVTWLYDTVDKVEKMLNEVTEKDKFEYVKAETNSYSRYMSSSFDYNTRDWKRTASELCWECLGNFDEDGIITIADGDYCLDCYEKLYSSCLDCGRVFKDTTKTHLKCEACRK